MAARILDFKYSEPPASDEPQAQPANPSDQAPQQAGRELVIEADTDGRRVRLSAKEEIVFECGEASITLKSDGRVIVRGSYVETHSTGTNRIKGGQVRIN